MPNIERQISHETTHNPNEGIVFIDKPTSADIMFINGLYQTEKMPIFEQNWIHVLTYLSFEAKVYTVAKKTFSGILIEREDKNILFTPRTTSEDFAEELASTTDLWRNNEITIQNVSEDWIKRNSNSLKNRFDSKMHIKPRSREEAVYSTSLLNNLPGQDFANLRNTRNKLITSGRATFSPVNEQNLDSALALIDKWNTVQGAKYEKKRAPRERFALRTLCELAIEGKPNFETCEIDGNIVGLSLGFKSPTHPDWGINYFIKGINRPTDGGIHGTSDACYLRNFDLFKRLETSYINDGELGTETGTRDHKLRFKPVKMLKSFDVVISKI